jgi:thiol-disulfide isomerase/thioredoxin
MNNVRRLTEEDFRLFPKKNGKPSLGNYLNGVSLVLFKSNNCGHCVAIEPIFVELSRRIHSCTFASINVSQYMSIVQYSANTSTPITYTPLLILYVNGKPFLRYDSSDRSLQAIGTFVTGVIDQLKSTIPTFGDSTVLEVDEIKGETIGGVIPYNIICDKDVCYLTSREIQGLPKNMNTHQSAAPSAREILSGAMNGGNGDGQNPRRYVLNQQSGMGHM